MGKRLPQETKQRIWDALQQAKSCSRKHIAEVTGISLATISKYLNEFGEDGLITREINLECPYHSDLYIVAEVVSDFEILEPEPDLSLIEDAIEIGDQLNKLLKAEHYKKNITAKLQSLSYEFCIGYLQLSKYMNIAKYYLELLQQFGNGKAWFPRNVEALITFIRKYKKLPEPLKKEWIEQYLALANQRRRALNKQEIITLFKQDLEERRYELRYHP